MVNNLYTKGLERYSVLRRDVRVHAPEAASFSIQGSSCSGIYHSQSIYALQLRGYGHSSAAAVAGERGVSKFSGTCPHHLVGMLLTAQPHELAHDCPYACRRHNRPEYGLLTVAYHRTACCTACAAHIVASMASMTSASRAPDWMECAKTQYVQ